MSSRSVTPATRPTSWSSASHPSYSLQDLRKKSGHKNGNDPPMSCSRDPQTNTVAHHRTLQHSSSILMHYRALEHSICIVACPIPRELPNPSVSPCASLHVITTFHHHHAPSPPRSVQSSSLTYHRTLEVPNSRFPPTIPSKIPFHIVIISMTSSIYESRRLLHH
jgi:hypothetical protein